MTPLVGLCALLTLPPSEEVFLFPRPVAATTTPSKAVHGFDRDFERAIGALRSAVRTGGLGQPKSVDDTVRAEELDRVLYGSVDKSAVNSTERRTYPVEMQPDVAYRGFWQTRYEFSLGGLILGHRIKLYSTTREEVYYRTLRGYWKDYGTARVFFGAGTQARFTIAPRWLFGPYSAHSRALPPSEAFPADTKTPILLTQTYGADVLFLCSPAVCDRSLPSALQKSLDLVDGQFGARFAGGIATVEPILIGLPPKVASLYVSESLSAGTG